MKVFADKLGYGERKFMNFKKLWFLWKPVDVQLGTISENARIGECYQCAKFYACIKKCTICLKFPVMPPDKNIERIHCVSSSHANLLEQKKCLHKKRVELP